MLSLRAGIDTLRYWDNALVIAGENASRADRARLHLRLRGKRPDFDALSAAIMRHGVAIVPGYWSAERCAEARAEIDRLIAAYPATVRIFSAGSDKRMFGVEAVSPLLASFHSDPFLRGVGEWIGGLELYNFATLGARIDATADNNGSGDGWHRDAYGFQFKSILYLSDAGEDSGAFEFLEGSHKRWRALVDTAIANLPRAPVSRYADEAINALTGYPGFSVKCCSGKAGTLLLANTSCIHRGRPLSAGVRYALTNYYYHPYQVDEGRIAQFSPLMPGAAERVRADRGIARLTEARDAPNIRDS
jgi:hypothetical protein